MKIIHKISKSHIIETYTSRYNINFKLICNNCGYSTRRIVFDYKDSLYLYRAIDKCAACVSTVTEDSILCIYNIAISMYRKSHQKNQ